MAAPNLTRSTSTPVADELARQYTADAIRYLLDHAAHAIGEDTRLGLDAALGLLEQDMAS